MIPKDPIMLLSFINLKLRDNYSDIEALCDDLDVDREEIDNILKSADYHYDRGANQYK